MQIYILLPQILQTITPYLFLHVDTRETKSGAPLFPATTIKHDPRDGLLVGVHYIQVSE